MKYFEPFQRLDHYVYLKADNAVYIQSSLSVFLPPGYSLVGRDPVYDNAITATLYNNSIIDNVAVDPYIFEQARLIKFIEKVPEAATDMDPKSLINMVRDTINKQLDGTGYFTVSCIVYGPKGAVGGQVTNTISSQAEVVII